MQPEDSKSKAKQPTLQELLERDKDKIAKIGESLKIPEATKVDPEDELLAEFGLYFGWSAVWAVKTNKLTAQDMYSLIMGARKVNTAHRYNKSIDMYYAFAATQTDKGGKAFTKHLGEIRNI